MSAELNEPERTELREEQEHNSHDQMPVSECQFAASKVLNTQFGQTEERGKSPSAGEEHGPDEGQISADRVVVTEMAHDQADYCSISSQHHRLPPTHFVHLMGEHVCALKRFLNRFVFISSHYRSYELTPSPSTEATSPVTSGLSHQPTDSSTSEVIHLNAEQVQPKL